MLVFNNQTDERLTICGMPVEFSEAIPPDRFMMVSLDESDPRDPTYNVALAGPSGISVGKIKRSVLREAMSR